LAKYPPNAFWVSCKELQVGDVIWGCNNLEKAETMSVWDNVTVVEKEPHYHSLNYLRDSRPKMYFYITREKPAEIENEFGPVSP
jgi:hypothetical protein